MKKLFALFIVALLSAMMLCSCGKTDYSQYSFTDKSFVRQTEADSETIRFCSDGTFTYSCACGSPVDDYDLVEKYSYNEENSTITLSYQMKPENAVTKIKIIEYTDTSITLDFNGEIRLFTIDE